MTIDISPELDIKRMPPDADRAAIRREAQTLAGTLTLPLRKPALEDAAARLLSTLHLPLGYLGFAMVALSNATWQSTFAAVPFHRRLLLLPHCLRDRASCRGDYSATGLHCAGCGSCIIDGLLQRAHDLGYRVIVAEGTSAVVTEVVAGHADAILGVACLDSLEKSFARMGDLGIPNLAIPLLRDGCDATEADIDTLLPLLECYDAAQEARVGGYLPILRATHRLFTLSAVRELLDDLEGLSLPDDHPLRLTERIALDWLAQGGKRLRPFITLTTYLLARHGERALVPDADIEALLPAGVRRLAVAIEAFHKASLVHDDIEDGDAERSGRPTVHRQYGLAQAINVGDYLVGLGYRLIAAADTPAMAAIVHALSRAHLALCRGQGADLAWTTEAVPVRDVLAIYAQKTAPAFEAALAVGWLAAGTEVDSQRLARLSTYLGEGFQIQNDLDGWQRDALAERPTLLRAFALEAGAGERLAAVRQLPAEERVAALAEIYRETGAWAKAEGLLDKLLQRTLALTQEFDPPALRDFLDFLARMVLLRVAESTVTAREP
jgi:geranylgeranyl pyrophosphate synthase